MLVKLVVIIAKFLLHPAGQRGRFIIEENTPVLHMRCGVNTGVRLDIEILRFLYRHIRPPVPGRDTYLLANIVNPISRAASVATDNHQSLLYARQWLAYRLNHI